MVDVPESNCRPTDAERQILCCPGRDSALEGAPQGVTKALADARRRRFPYGGVNPVLGFGAEIGLTRDLWCLLRRVKPVWRRQRVWRFACRNLTAIEVAVRV